MWWPGTPEPPWCWGGEWVLPGASLAHSRVRQAKGCHGDASAASRTVIPLWSLAGIADCNSNPQSRICILRQLHVGRTWWQWQDLNTTSPNKPVNKWLTTATHTVRIYSSVHFTAFHGICISQSLGPGLQQQQQQKALSIMLTGSLLSPLLF